jgi:hypothetical protein
VEILEKANGMKELMTQRQELTAGRGRTMKSRRIERIGADSIETSRAPEKRSDRVLDNWREPVLIRFLRLNLNDPEEIERFLALNCLDRLFQRNEDMDAEKLQAYVLAHIDQVRQNPEDNLLWLNPPNRIRQILGPLQWLTRHILEMLAERKIERGGIDNLNERLHKLGAVPQIYLPFPEEPEEEPMQFGMGIKVAMLTPQHELRVLEMALLTRLYDTVLRHAHLFREPGSRSEYALCPVCDRIFAKTRLDRLFCCYQCADSVAGRKIKYGRKRGKNSGTGS